MHIEPRRSHAAITTPGWKMTAAPSQPLLMSQRLVWFGFLGICAVLVWPILSHLYQPMTDLPNHIARHHILAQGETTALAEYYHAEFALVPNAAADLLWFFFAEHLDPARFSQWVTAAYPVNFLASIMVLARVLQGKWTLWPLAAGLFVFNGNYFWGFQNYISSVPFLIYGFALWMMIERQHLALRLALLIPVGAFLFIMHFFAFAIFGVLAAGRELQRLVEAPRQARWQRFASGLAMSLPFVLPLLWLISQMLGQPQIQGSKTDLPTLYSLLIGLSSLIVQPVAERYSFVWLTGAAITCLLIVALLTLRHPRWGHLQVQPSMKGPLLALLLVGVCAPFWLNGVAFANIRIPFVLAAVFVASTQWQGLSHRLAVAIALIVCLLMLARSWAIERVTAQHDAEVRGLVELLEVLPQGARVLPLRAPDMEFDARVMHLQAYATVYRNAYVPTLFQGVHMLEVLPEWLEMSHPAGHAVSIDWLLRPGRIADQNGGPKFWEHWQDRYTHALLLDTVDPSLTAQLPWRLIAEQGRFSLYEVLASPRSPE